MPGYNDRSCRRAESAEQAVDPEVGENRRHHEFGSFRFVDVVEHAPREIVIDFQRRRAFRRKSGLPERERKAGCRRPPGGAPRDNLELSGVEAGRRVFGEFGDFRGSKAQVGLADRDVADAVRELRCNRKRRRIARCEQPANRFRCGLDASANEFRNIARARVVQIVDHDAQRSGIAQVLAEPAGQLGCRRRRLDRTFVGDREREVSAGNVRFERVGEPAQKCEQRRCVGWNAVEGVAVRASERLLNRDALAEPAPATTSVTRRSAERRRRSTIRSRVMCEDCTRAAYGRRCAQTMGAVFAGRVFSSAARALLQSVALLYGALTMRLPCIM